VISVDTAKKLQHNQELVQRMEVLEKTVQVLQQFVFPPLDSSDSPTIKPTDTTVKSSHDLQLLKHINEPTWSVEAWQSIDNYVHQLIYRFLHVVQSVKARFVQCRQHSWFEKIFVHNKAAQQTSVLNQTANATTTHGSEARKAYVQSHSTIQIAGEYVFEVSLVVAVLIVGFILFSAVLLCLFLSCMWLCFNNNNNK
jgi:HD-GYP domain-containing protein (c-di-GMP phosphodiesterase class II)